MQTITAIIIAKNEEEMIADCLRSVSFCDEIIVIDGGSRDNTAEVAKKYGARVVNFSTDDFSKARNFGLKHAKSDWLLYIDADERVSRELMVHIKAKISHSQGYSAYKIKRKNFYFYHYEWPQIERLERLFQKRMLKKWYGRLHESAVIEGKIGEIDGYLVHFTHRDLSQMLKKTLVWSTTEAELRVAAAHPEMTWWRFPRVMLSAFYSSFIQQKGWRVGAIGLIESMFQAYSAFVTYAKLWEMQKSK